MLEIIYRHDPESSETTEPHPADAAQARDRPARGNQRLCDLVNDDT